MSTGTNISLGFSILLFATAISSGIRSSAVKKEATSSGLLDAITSAENSFNDENQSRYVISAKIIDESGINEIQEIRLIREKDKLDLITEKFQSPELRSKIKTGKLLELTITETAYDGTARNSAKIQIIGLNKAEKVEFDKSQPSSPQRQ